MVQLPDSEITNRLLRILFLIVFVFNIVLPMGIVSADGEAGYALSFDGVNDYVVIDLTNTVMGGDGWKDSMTVSLWVKPIGSGYCTNIDVVHCDSIVGDRPRWWGVSHGIVNGDARIWVWNYDGSVDKIGIPYTEGEWMHLAWVHSGGMLSAYKNGSLVASIPSSTTNVAKYWRYSFNSNWSSYQQC